MKPARKVIDSGGNRADQERIEKRVDDWALRIRLLYDAIEAWIAGKRRLSAARTRQIMISEELMRIHGIPALNIEILDISRDGEIILSIIPHGLWVLGANGRLDVMGSKKTWILVDESAPLTRKPKWTLFSSSIVDQGKPFNRVVFGNLLKAS